MRATGNLAANYGYLTTASPKLAAAYRLYWSAWLLRPALCCFICGDSDMKSANDKFKPSFIDYIWYVAETWSAREHNNLNGGMLLFLGWLFAIVIPGGLLIGYYFGPQCAIQTLILCFMPSIFCKLRYTANHREALRCHYGKLKHPGRKLTQIILCCIALTIVNFALTLFICPVRSI